MFGVVTTSLGGLCVELKDTSAGRRAASCRQLGAVCVATFLHFFTVSVFGSWAEGMLAVCLH